MIVDWTEVGQVARPHDLWITYCPENSRLLPYEIRNGADNDRIINRGHDLEAAVRWMRVFVEREGGTVDETTVEIARGAARQRQELREALALAPVVRLSDGRVVA